MNKPVCITQTREQLLQRLSTRRPLYQAIKENLPNSKALHAELMEPRVLLSADLVPVADALEDAVENAGNAIDDFFDQELLNQSLPLLVLPGETEPAAATLNELLSIDVDLNGVGTNGEDNGGISSTLDSYDNLVGVGDGNGKVSLKEFFHGAFINPVKEKLASVTETAPLDSSQFNAFLNTISADFDGQLTGASGGLLDFDVSNATFTDAPDGSGIEFNLTFDLSLAKSVSFDLGTGLESKGLTIEEESIKASVGTVLTFDLGFGVDGIVPAQGEDTPETDDDVAANYGDIAFYAKLGDLTAAATGSLVVDNVDARFGFLGLEADLNVAFAASVLAEGDETAKRRAADLAAGFSSLYPNLSAVGSISGDANLAATLSGNMTGEDLPGVTLAFNADPFNTSQEDGRFAPNVSVTSGELDAYANFNLISASSYIGLIEQLAQSLDVVGNSGDISDYQLPFANTSFGELVSFSDTLIDALIFDEGPTEAAGDDTAGLLMKDANGQLVPKFNTVQGLADTLDSLVDIGPEDGSGINLAYANDALTLSLDLTSTFAEVDVPLEFNLDLEPLASVALTQGALVASANGRIQLTVGVDLSGGTDKTLTPQTKLDGTTSSDTEQTQLGSPIEGAELAITGDPLPLKSYDSQDALFTIEISDAIGSQNGNYEVKVPVLEESGDLRPIASIVEDIRNALNGNFENTAQGIRTLVDAEQSFSGGVKFFSQGDSTFKFVAANDVALEVLGLSGALTIVQTDGEADTILSKTFSTDSSQEGAPSAFGAAVGIPADFTLSSNLNILINGQDLEIKASETSDNTNIRALASDLQQAVDANETLAGKIAVSSVRSELVIKVVNEVLNEGTPEETIGAPLLSELSISAAPALGFSAQTETYESTTGEVSSADFLINTANGQSYEISLAGLEVIQDLIDEVRVASGGTGSSDPGDSDYEGDVTLRINEDGTALELIDNSFPGGSVQPFAVLAVNGSAAAYQLGISGIDDADPDEYDGKIEGSTTVAGKTLADRLFVDDVTLTAGVDVSPANKVNPDTGLELDELDLIEANASFGFVDVVLTDGQVDLGAEIEVGLKNPDESPASGEENRITLAQFKESFGSLDDLSKLVATPTLTGSVGDGDDFATVDFKLNLASDVPGLGNALELLGTNDGLDISATVTGLAFDSEDEESQQSLEITTNIADVLDGLPILDLSNVGISEILDGIIAVSDFLQDFEEFEFLSQDIPLIELSVNDLLSFADQLDAAVQSSLDDPAGSLQGLQSALLSALGLEAPAPGSTDPSPVQFSLVQTNGDAGAENQVLRVDIVLETSVSESLGLDFDLSDFTDVLEEANLAGSADLRADGTLALNVAFGIDLGISDTNELGDIYLFEETGISGGLDVVGDDLTFRAAVGPLGIYIQEGEAAIEVDASAGISTDLLIFDADETSVIGFDDLKDSVSTSITGDLYAALPVYFPTDSILAGEIVFSAGTGTPEDLGDDLNLFDLSSSDFVVSGVDSILNSFNPLELSLLDNIALVVDGVDLFLAGLQDILDGEVGGVALPLIGDSLSDGARFIEDFRNGFVDDFREAVATVDSSEGAIITDMLQGLLDDIGLGTATVSLSGKTNIFGDDAAPVAESVIQWDLELGDEYTISEGVDLDLGIPGLGLETEGDVSLTIDWGLNLALGLDFVNGAYLDFGTEGEDEGDLRFGVTVGLPTSIKGNLGFLQLTAGEREGGPVSGLTADFAVDIVDGNDEEVGVVGFANLGSISFAPSVNASADVDLDLELSVGDGVFPTITSAFVMDWDLIGEDGGNVPVAEIGDAIGKGLQKVGFEDVELDLGSFLSDFLAPTLGAVQDVTEPLSDIIDFITAPLPVISDLGPSLSLVDIAEVFGDVDLGFIDSIADVVALVNAIDTNSGEPIAVPYGDFTIYERGDGTNGTDAGDANLSDPRADLSGLADDPARNDSTKAKSLDNQLKSGSSGGGASKLSKLKSAGSFAIPLFDDPTQVFGLLTGSGDATLLTFDMKPLSVDFEYSQYFPIFGPLGAAVTGSLGLTADFAFGFDTTGISQFADSDFRNPEYIFNGFYVSDTDDPLGTGEDVAELILNLGLSASAELNLGIAKGGAGGGVFADIFFDLYDPNDDGRVRIEEILGSIENQIQFADGAAKALAPLAIFDVTGEIYAKLFAYLTLGVGPFSVDYDFDITPPITILDFEIPFERPPQLLTEVDGGAVQLNFGELAEFRGEGDLSDSDDNIVVSGGGRSLTVNGVTYSLDQDLEEIVILGGAGNDRIDVRGVSSNVVFDIDGGAGNDIIMLPSAVPVPAIQAFSTDLFPEGPATNTVLGGAGDDTIYGSDGRDIIIGGDGFDKIYGRGGDDRLFGDSVKLSDNQIQVSLGGTDVTDIIEGGNGNDIIAGGGGADTIDGGIGNDLILGDGGILQVLVEDSNGDSVLGESGLGLPTASVWTAANITVIQSDRNGGGNDTIEGDEGNDIVYAGRGDDTVGGGINNDTLYGGPGLDIIDGDDGDDTIYGGDNNDILSGNLGDDWIYGEDGADVIEGNENNDYLFGGADNDLIHGNDGDDWLRGGLGPDTLYGDAGADYLDGEYDNDILFGDEGPESPLDDTESDLNGDILVSSFGSDILRGEGDGDTYRVNFSGGTTDRLIETIDPSGGDRLEVTGSVAPEYSTIAQNLESTGPIPDAFDLDPSDFDTGADDVFLLRANQPQGFGFVAMLNEGVFDDLYDIFIAANDAFEASEEVDSLQGLFGEDPYSVTDEQLDGEGITLAEYPYFFEAREAQKAYLSYDVFIAATVAFEAGEITMEELEGARNAYLAATDFPVERVNYTSDIEALVVSSGAGEDYFQLDDNLAPTTIDGGDNSDTFQIGQVYDLPRTTLFDEANIQAPPSLFSAPEIDSLYELAPSDAFGTEVTTRGYLSVGISHATTILGGNEVGKGDTFKVFRNDAPLTLKGQYGEDSFEVRAFALGESVEAPDQDRTNISGGEAADSIQYAVNAPVDIDGGEGIDTVTVIGTEFGDDFIVTADGIFGGGLNVAYVNIEVLKVDGAEGDDRFFIQSTGVDVQTTQIVGGLGSDSFNVASDTPPIISDDLRGHSGKISHTIVTPAGSVYDEVRVRDVVANVADSNEAGIVIIPQSESVRVGEADIPANGALIDIATYAVVLTRPPAQNETVTVKVASPNVDKDTQLVSFVPVAGSTISNNIVTLEFNAGNWDQPQNVSFEASDVNLEAQYGNISHTVTSNTEVSFKTSNVNIVNDAPSVTVEFAPDAVLPPYDGLFKGASVTIDDGPGKGQTRKIESFNGDNQFDLASAWDVLPTDESTYKIVLVNGDRLVGEVSAAANNTTVTMINNAALNDVLPESLTDGGEDANDGGNFRGATLTYVDEAGNTESRLIMSNTAASGDKPVFTINKPWTTAPTSDATFYIKLYESVTAPALTVGVNTDDVPPKEDTPPSPGIKVIETLGSTDVIEPFVGVDAPAGLGEAYSDSYQLELTQSSDEDVKVYIKPEETITTRGQIFNKAVQVDVEVGGDVLEDEGGYYVLFAAGESGEDYRKTVNIVAVGDSVVDGGDTKVFPTIPRTLSGIQGTLEIFGQGDSEQSIGSLGNPLMLPGENNTVVPLGKVISSADGLVDSVTVDASDVSAFVADNKLGLAENLVNYTFIVTAGPAQGQAFVISEVDSLGGEVTFKFRSEYQWGDERPNADSSFTLVQTNPNLLVDEAAQVDVITVFNDEAVENQSGVLTSTELSGLGMGAGATIKYEQLENFTLNLGKGSDELTVNSTHTRGGVDASVDGFFQTVTLVNAGRGDDTIYVNLDAASDGFFAVKGEEGDDTIDASGDEQGQSGSTLGIVAFGDEGSDTLIGGKGNDLLLGDIGRIDYLDGNGKVITRLGLEHDFLTMDPVVEVGDGSSGRTPTDQTTGLLAGVADEAESFTLSRLPDVIVSLDRNIIDVELPKNVTIDEVIVAIEDIDFTDATIQITGGTGSSEDLRTIERFDGTSFEVSQKWDEGGIPDNTSVYKIVLADDPATEANEAGTEIDGKIGDVKRAANNTTDGEDILRGNKGSDILIGGAADDRIDGGANIDLILGDNAQLISVEGGGNLSELEQTLDPDKGPRLYDEEGNANVTTGSNLINNSPFDLLDLTLLNHETGATNEFFGDDYIAGGADDDLIFGQKGKDTVQGDGNITDQPDVGATVTDGELTIVASSDNPKTDGNDYIEGNDGEDTLFGNLGQDIIIGGSSDLFGLDKPGQRKDGSDLIFGGSGTQVSINDDVDAGHAIDADYIFGDNARVVSVLLAEDETYNFNKKIAVRAYTLLDYTPGVDSLDTGRGAADELHGERGDDTIHGMIGNDVLFGEGHDDNIIGGVGYDRIYGGAGVDGIIGDDGLIQTSRNGFAEPLNGVAEPVRQQLLETKGPFVGAVVNPKGKIHKAAELHAWTETEEATLNEEINSNDVIYGGLGDDFIHGGSGDDAISGAEALGIHYHSQPQDQATITGGAYSYDPANPLQYNLDSVLNSVGERKFGDFDAEDPRTEILDFLLNFNTFDGDERIDDGIDHIFGDLGNDWIVGGTQADRMFGGLGDDLINADDYLETVKTDADEKVGDFAYGGGGLDVLIANTGRDRLFDWNGEYNSFYVPFSRFGAPTVNRKISPDTVEFLEQLGEFSGADMNLGEDSSFFDELGLVDNADELTKEQKGSPRDPQPGNMKGKFDDAGEPEELNLLAADFPEDYSTDVVVIDDLRAVGQAAVERWLASGELNDAQLTQLSGMVLQIADLGGLKLAQASSDGKTIYIDSNAAGYGWFVDSTAMQDEEFQAGHADAGNVAGKMDLLSVVMHEIGHQLGFGHGDSGVMHEALDAGVRSAGLLAEGSVYTFDDDSGLATAASDEHDHGWVEVATASVASEHSGEQSAQVDWNDSF